MDYLSQLLASDNFTQVVRTMITTAEDITFAIIDDEMKVQWVNDLALSLACKPRDQVEGTHYLSWYKDDLEITEHQFAQAREKGLSDNAVVTSTSGAYLRRRIFRIDGGYASLCVDFSRIADAKQQTRDIDTAIKVLADSKNRIVRDAQLNVLDMVSVQCQALCRYDSELENEPCPALQQARVEIQEGRPQLDFALTPSELNVARLVRQGLTRKEIATGLGISENTVRNHSTAIRKKCGLKKREVYLAEYLQRFRI